MKFRGLVRVTLQETPWTLSSGPNNQGTVAAPTNPPIVYFHGGGFVAANACVLTQSVVPVVRGGANGGFHVYAADYPMGQSGAFPLPILSGLKLLRHVLKDRGVEECHVYGDSAGAGVASYVVALVCNSRLLRVFQQAVRRHFAIAQSEGRQLPFSLDDYDSVLCDEAWGLYDVVRELVVFHHPV